MSLPWLVMGDFNDISSLDEKRGVAEFRVNAARKFMERCEECSLSDFGSSGCKFTWKKTLHGRVILREGLDRVLANAAALEYFSNGKVVNLPCIYSDHHPLLFDDALISPPPSVGRPFRFQAAWITHKDFDVVFRDAWDSGVDLLDAVTVTKENLQVWNAEVFGSILTRKRVLMARLAGIQRSEAYDSSSFLQTLEKELLRDYQDTLYQEEILFYHKSRSQWIRDGDRNTKFYHLSTLVRRNRDKVTRLKINGDWVDDTETLKQHAVAFYKELFTSKVVQALPDMLYRWQPLLNLQEKEALLIPFSLDEAKTALFSMHGLKAPGPDGIQPLFL